jgi:CRISPR-associated protein Csm4
LFGAICWRWLELFPDTFEGMLEEFRAGSPPFCLSDAWPDDLMPLPGNVIPAANVAATARKLKPPFFVTGVVFRSLMEGAHEAPVLTGMVQASGRVRTAIDRELGSAADGQLFDVDTQHLNATCQYLSVYIRSERCLEQVEACLRAQAWSGFGKKSSSGLGEFEVAGPAEKCEWLDGVSGANAWVALSHFVPAAGDPVEGSWRIHVTYPKFHGTSTANVFKGSIVMMTPGSVFRVSGGEGLRAWYGSMIGMPRPEMPKALHYGLCFAVPMVWAEGES